MPTLPRITGTFLDEITHDIPSQNWGAREWRKEFELYKLIGIDTKSLAQTRPVALGRTCADLGSGNGRA